MGLAFPGQAGLMGSGLGQALGRRWARADAGGGLGGLREGSYDMVQKGRGLPARMHHILILPPSATPMSPDPMTQACLSQPQTTLMPIPNHVLKHLLWYAFRHYQDLDNDTLRLLPQLVSQA